MYIKLHDKEYTLDEIIKDDTIYQGLVKICNVNDFGKYYSIQKIKSSYNLRVLVFSTVYTNEDIIKNLDLNNTRFFLAYDNEAKIILHDNVVFKYMPETVLEYTINPLREEYTFYTISEEYEKINKLYNDKLNKELDSNFDYYMTFPKYKQLYNAIIENKSAAENLYLEGRESYDITFQINDDYSLCPLNTVYDYIIDNSLIDTMVSRKIEESFMKSLKEDTVDYYSTHARKMANLRLLKEIEANPSYRVKLVKSILKATKPSYKTLNLTLKNGKKIKVVNKLVCSYEAYRTVKGNELIYVEDISQIIYGKKILFDISEVA